MQYDVDGEGDRCRRAARARPVMKCCRAVHVATVARAPARKAASMLCRATRSGRGDRAPDRGCRHFFPFFAFVEIAPDRALWALVLIFFLCGMREGMSSCPSLKNDKCTRKFWLGGITSIWSVRFDSWDWSGGADFPVYV
jgi:hypothetical protein